MTYRKAYRKHKVFVYGTLKTGFSNHFFLESQKLLGPGGTVHPYALYEDEYPIVVADEPVSRIRGEVYEVNDAILKRLDTLEDHPDYYRRRQVEVELDDGETVTAWLYFFPKSRGRLFSEGEWLQPAFVDADADPGLDPDLEDEPGPGTDSG